MGIETGGPRADLALIDAGRVMAEASHPVLSHGAELPEAAGRLLASAGLALNELRAIAVGIGPGSFTGLRIGLSYAKGLALATGCALAGIPSLDSLALTAVAEDRTAPGRLICPVLDARKGEVYAALYRTTGDGLEKLSDDLVVTLANLVPHLGTDVLLVGDAKAAEACALAARAGGQATCLELGVLSLRGRVVAALGAARVAAGAADNAFVMEPLYVRTAEATFKAGPLTSGAMGNGAEGRSTDPSVRNHR
ncbi:MAG TPA: tRNA (adenosine(37)-N6)-threonylcarbamoyltransferase complex dimerization subunit type 1 TsaB [Candidatus Binataceae bacterium]|nr:tRNA (adenosine(37)-N6)-threonylcarbamoyltransferase complex dimerization subunit type 1 TsaB [Candidatus Binataceae bacterium]